MVMHTRIVTTVYIGLCLLLILLCGCGKNFSTVKEEKEIPVSNQSLIVVGVSQVGSESVWRTANSNSIQKVFTKEKGYFLDFQNARQKQENQIKAIRGFISQQVDYIVFSPIMEDGWDTVLQEAKEANIPVILMDRQVNVKDESLYTTWVGSNFFEEGQKAGRWLEEYLEKSGRTQEEIKILVLVGTEGATSVIGRTKGFHEIASRHDNWQIVSEVNGEYTTSKGKEVTKQVLRTRKDIDVIVSQNDDMTFGALEAIEEAGLQAGENGDILVISFDAVKAALKLVKDGKISVDIECNPEQGEYIESVISTLERGEQVEKAYYVPEKIFTKENVEEFIDERTY